MKIAILSCFHPYRGGIAQFNNSLYRELGKEHQVLAFNFKRQYPGFLFPGESQYVEKSSPVDEIPGERILDTANPLSYLRTAKAIRSHEPDLLLMRYWMPYFAPSQGYVARHIGNKTKVISILDNVIPHERRFMDATFTRYFINGNDAFVVLCNAVGEDLLRMKPDARYIVSPHPVYSNFGERVDRKEAAARIGIDPERKTLLFFGLIREYKGLDILMEAFSRLDDSYQLVIAGEAYGSFERYERLMEASPNKENIHLFNRFIADDQVADFFCASDLCVLPYRSATQSGISAISYHFDLPLVTTAVGGLKEMIGERGTGIVTGKITPDAIKEAIEEYFSDPDGGERYRTAIREEKERLSWGAFCNRLISLYEQL